jgi:hypothetical protein
MNGLTDWSARHGVSAAALQELRRILMQPVVSALHATSEAALSDAALSEAAVQNNLRLNCSRAGIVTFRNNSGAGKMDNGSFVRFGLCNESPAQNASMKSSDIIGIKPTAILPEHVGRIAGIFYARECKPSNWKRPSDDREIAQQRFIFLINSLGGDAAFHNGTEL